MKLWNSTFLANYERKRKSMEIGISNAIFYTINFFQKRTQFNFSISYSLSSPFFSFSLFFLSEIIHSTYSYSVFISNFICSFFLFWKYPSRTFLCNSVTIETLSTMNSFQFDSKPSFVKRTAFNSLKNAFLLCHNSWINYRENSSIKKESFFRKRYSLYKIESFAKVFTHTHTHTYISRYMLMVNSIKRRFSFLVSTKTVFVVFLLKNF